jgi:hypothetical protein
LDDVADRLYALPPEDFVATRDALAKDATTAGDKARATAIKALRKPSVVAWALNLLVREDRASVEQLISLGADLRQAQTTLSGDDLRALGRQRHQLVRAVAGRAADLAEAAGRPLPRTQVDQVATSLDAALTDPANAALLLSGHLSTALEYAGLGEATPTLSLVPPPPKETGRRAKPDPKEVRLAKAAVQAAEADLAQAETDRKRSREVLSAAHLRAGVALERLQAAQEESDLAKAEEDTAVRAEREATRSEEIATLRLEQARAHLAELGPG